MTTDQAIAMIHAPKGMTSIIAGITTGYYSVLPHEKGKNAALEKAREMVAHHEKQIIECKSDWAYWSILGDLEYWKAIEKILIAGSLNNGIVADVPAPDLDGLVVMDAIGRVSDFGDAVLSETRKLIVA